MSKEKEIKSLKWIIGIACAILGGILAIKFRMIFLAVLAIIAWIYAFFILNKIK